MAPILQSIIFTIFLTLVAGLPAHNVTLFVPDGYTDHGNNDLYCTSSQWYDIIIFFAVNYASHAATIKSRPGQTYMHSARDAVLTLIYPYTGLARALESLARSSHSANDLRKAARAGALCIIIRNKDWKPSWRTRILARMPKGELSETPCIHTPGDNLEPEIGVTEGEFGKEIGVQQACREPSGKVMFNRTHIPPTHIHDGSSNRTQFIDLHMKQEENSCRISASYKAPSIREGSESFAQSSVDKAPGSPSRLRSFLDQSNIWTRNIQGECRLPEGYSVATLPSNATIASSSHQDLNNVTISCSHSIPKVVVAIVQATYAIITVYRAQGDQIDRFGYAAFGFTVLPYIVMSLMNLLSALLLPDYPTLYIVRSLESDEATLLGGTVDGAIGRLVQRKDLYLNFLHSGSVCEEDGEQDVNGIDEGDMTANQSICLGSRRSHFEEDSPRGYAGSTVSLITSLPSDTFDAKHYVNYERHWHGGGENRHFAAQEGIPSQNWLKGDNEDITYKSARHVKRLKPNRPDQHASYTQFATNGDTERWQMKTQRWYKNQIFLASIVMACVFPIIPLAVIGGMTHFHKGHSTQAQRAWTMTWLACNLSMGPLLDWGFDPSHRPDNIAKRGKEVLKWYPIVFAFVYAVPAIGGFVTVGQMLREYGSCTFLDGL